MVGQEALLKPQISSIKKKQLELNKHLWGSLFLSLAKKQKGKLKLNTMKIITHLSHTAKEMNESIFGWDIFRCRDYSNLDKVIDEPIDFSEISQLDPIFGYTIIFAVNLKVIKLFKRLFVRTT